MATVRNHGKPIWIPFTDRWGYARRSRLVWLKNPSPRTSS